MPLWTFMSCTFCSITKLWEPSWLPQAGPFHHMGANTENEHVNFLILFNNCDHQNDQTWKKNAWFFKKCLELDQKSSMHVSFHTTSPSHLFFFKKNNNLKWKSVSIWLCDSALHEYGFQPSPFYLVDAKFIHSRPQIFCPCQSVHPKYLTKEGGAANDQKCVSFG